MAPVAQRIRPVLIAFLGALVANGCRAHDASVELYVGGHPFQVEIADTPEARSRGLMFREELAPDEGMLFVFPDTQPRSFWMRNTPLPLSIAYIDERGRILEIHAMEPYSEVPVRSRNPARYALEVNRGRFRELGIEPGDRIDLADLPALDPR